MVDCVWVDAGIPSCWLSRLWLALGLVTAVCDCAFKVLKSFWGWFSQVCAVCGCTLGCHYLVSKLALLAVESQGFLEIVLKVGRWSGACWVWVTEGSKLMSLGMVQRVHGPAHVQLRGHLYPVQP